MIITQAVDTLRRRIADDSGTTLLELVVGMVIMTIFMGMFTTAILVMSNTTNTVQVAADTSNQATDAYLRLDREIRYASAISTPSYSATAAMWHVEFATTIISRSGTNTVTNTTQCTQLAVAPPSASNGNVGVLQQRTWTVGATQANPWGVLASNVSNYGSSTSTSPFPATSAISGGNASTSMQQLTIKLAYAEPTSTTTTTSSYTFTAVNSSTSNTASVCQQFAVGS